MPLKTRCSEKVPHSNSSYIWFIFCNQLIKYSMLLVSWHQVSQHHCAYFRFHSIIVRISGFTAPLCVFQVSQHHCAYFWFHSIIVRISGFTRSSCGKDFGYSKVTAVMLISHFRGILIVILRRINCCEE